MHDFITDINSYFELEIETIKKLDKKEINDAMNAITKAWDRGATIWTMGNGGSAATASHFVCDFNKGISEKIGGKKFNLRCLSDNVSMLTAIANDIDYEDVFSFQLEGVMEPRDLLIAISGSGNSKNVLKAAQYAQKIGAKVVGVTGYNGGELKELSDYCMHVPVEDMQVAEDIHMMFDHMMFRVLGNKL